MDFRNVLVTPESDTGAIEPDGVSFGMEGQYLAKFTDLDNNTDSDAFTLSFWIFAPAEGVSGGTIYQSGDIDHGLHVYADDTNIYIKGYDSTASEIFTTQHALDFNAWSHILLSADGTETKNTSKLYINDVYAASPTPVTSGKDIDFTQSKHYIGRESATTGDFYGRISRFYLDQTFRNLEKEDNRRLFINEDGSAVEDLGNAKPYMYQYPVTQFGNTFYRCYAAATYNNEIYVSYNSASIYKYDYNGNYLSSISYTALGSYDTAMAVENGYIWFYDATEDKIYKYTLSGEDTGDYIPTTNLDTMCSMTSDGAGYIYALGSSVAGQSTLYTYDATNYANTNTFSIDCDVSGNDVAIVYKSGYIYVLQSADKMERYNAVTGVKDTSYLVTTIFRQYSDNLIDVGTKFYYMASGTDGSGPVAYTIDYTQGGGYWTTPPDPTMYLPLRDANSAGLNEGSGGDLTAYGYLPESDVGSQELVCSSSYFEDTYMSSYSAYYNTSKIFVYSCIVSITSVSSDDAQYSSSNLRVELNTTSFFLAEDDSNNTIISLRLLDDAQYISASKTQYLVSMYIDMDSQANCKFFLDNKDITSSIVFYTFIVGEEIEIDGHYRIGGYPTRHTGYLGEVYVDDVAGVDFSGTDNPFWDTGIERPKPVETVIQETGHVPLIAVPLAAEDIGVNLGSIGGFLAIPATNSKVSPSKYISRGICTNNIELAVIPETFTTLSMYLCLRYYDGDADYTYPIQIIGSTSNSYIRVYVKDTRVLFYVYENNTSICSFSIAFDTINYYPSTGIHIFIQVDLSGTNASRLFCVIPRRKEVLMDTDVPTGTSLNLTDGTWTSVLTSSVDISLHDVYLTKDYIDFSQEENRYLFMTGLGYPKDLELAISEGNIPQPLICLQFKDDDNLGTNTGTYNDFTPVTGVVRSKDFGIE